MICRDEFSVLARGKRAKNSDSHQGFRSLTAGMVRAVYEIIAPNTGIKTNPLNPFPASEIQVRNFLIVRLLLNYGLRISELLLLECRSIKPNIQGDKVRPPSQSLHPLIYATMSVTLWRCRASVRKKSPIFWGTLH